MAAETEKTEKPSKRGGGGGSSRDSPRPLVIARTPAEEQRLKLERLMRNPDKPAPVPERPRDWNPRAPPEFVRDVMGSSAGAGSGEFHMKKQVAKKAKEDTNNKEGEEKSSSSSSSSDDEDKEAEDDAEAPSFIMGK
ncbi:hypothetical protein CRUP_010146, partial [Coryphaenoides rupestris]